MTATGTPTRVALPEVLDLTAAGPLARSLLAVRGSDVEVDASQVRRLGGQCLQVLLSAVNTWRADGNSLGVVAPSAEFSAGLKQLGLAPAALMQEEHKS